MSTRRARRWMKWLQQVEFCDSCGRVCDPTCRSGTIRTEAVDRVHAMGLMR